MGFLNKNILKKGKWFYKNITPSLVNAVNLTPTGKLNRADWRAMCSLPFPDAIESATSRLLNLPLSFVENSFFSCINGLFGSNSMKSNGMSCTWNSFANAGPTIIIFSHSPFCINPETCPHVPFPVERSATNSID